MPTLATLATLSPARPDAPTPHLHHAVLDRLVAFDVHAELFGDCVRKRAPYLHRLAHTRRAAVGLVGAAGAVAQRRSEILRQAQLAGELWGRRIHGQKQHARGLRMVEGRCVKRPRGQALGLAHPWLTSARAVLSIDKRSACFGLRTVEVVDGGAWCGMASCMLGRGPCCSAGNGGRGASCSAGTVEGGLAAVLGRWKGG
eukprot:363417-Chlamydomonas_euryale.AAC.12